MATWVTHLRIADAVLKEMGTLDARGFCVGCIAPDCNVENADWSAFTPPREVTHWMTDARKTAADSARFWTEYAQSRFGTADAQQRSFLLGCYAHLIADAGFQSMIREEGRVRAVWQRIRTHPVFAPQAVGADETWDAAKRLLTKARLSREMQTMEAEYLEKNPQSGYITHILPLTAFPDHLDYMPSGCIARKVRVMGILPRKTESEFLLLSREEYAHFVHQTTRLTLQKLRAVDYNSR